MRQIFRGSHGKSAAGLVIAMAMLLLPAFLLLLPSVGQGGGISDLENLTGQKIPMPGKPSIAGIFCPKCKGYIEAPGGRPPRICPHRGCGYSFVQQAGPMFAPQPMPRLQTIDPFDDYLFHGVPIIPDDGKLKTRHFDPDGIAAKAEAWGKEMKQIEDQSRKKQEEDADDFARKKLKYLSRSNQPAGPKLSNIFAQGNPTVDLLREPDNTGGPIAPKKLSELADEELARRLAENAKKIHTLMGEAKLDIKNDVYEQKMRLGQQQEAGAAGEDMEKTAMDAFAYVGFTAGGDLLEKSQNLPWKKGLDRFDKSYNVYQNATDLAKASEEHDKWKAGASVGDAALAFAPGALAEHNLVARSPWDSTVLTEAEQGGLKIAGKEFVEKAGASYAIGKGLIGLSAGGYSYYNLWNQNAQLDALANQRADNVRIRGERLSELEEELKQIKAEQARRAASGNAL